MKKVTLLTPLKLNLQFFAEDGGDAGSNDSGDTGNNSGSDGSQDDDSGDNHHREAYEFTSQSELDAYTDKRIETALKTAKDKWSKEANQQKSYDQMTDSEKAAYDLKQTQDELEKTKLENLTLQNRAKVSAKLAEDKLPGSLIDIFGSVLGNDDKVINEAYTKVATVFRDAVKSGVDQRLAGSAEKPGANGTGAEQSMGETLAQQRNSNAKPAGNNPWASKNSGAWGDKK